MSFAREAQRVRDTSLPLGHRFRSLGTWIQMAQPLGFHPTLAYLEATLSRQWRDPAMLIPAMELLESERSLHLRAENEYSLFRRQQKALGHRAPLPGAVSPTEPRRWHGDERTGARFVLQDILRRPRDGGRNSPVYGDLLDHAAGLLRAGGTPFLLNSDALQSALEWARRQIHVVGWEADPEAFEAAWQMRHLLGQIYLLTEDVPALAQAWNFHPLSGSGD